MAFMMPAYLSGAHNKMKIKFNFPADSKRVAVVVKMPRNLKLDVGAFDTEVSEKLAFHMFKYLDKQPEVIKASVVRKALDEHDDWETPQQIGQGLKADHVVMIEIRKASLYDRPGWTQMLRGKCEAQVSVWCIGPNGTDAEAVYPRETVSLVYPSTDQPVVASEVPLSKFRGSFVDFVATRLSWYFVPHETGEEYGSDVSR